MHAEHGLNQKCMPDVAIHKPPEELMWHGGFINGIQTSVWGLEPCLGEFIIKQENNISWWAAAVPRNAPADLEKEETSSPSVTC